MPNEEEEEREVAKQIGCMASFFHFFDRPHMLSTSRDRSFSSSQSQMSGSVSPSERSEQSGPLVLSEKDNVNGKSRPPSPEPDPTRASLSVFKTASTWKLKEAPRLSLDSRLRPREIRTTVDRVQEPDDQNRRSPSVVARLMGVEILPTASGPGSPAQLRRSNSESRVPRDLYKFIDSDVTNNRRVFLPDPKVDPGPGPGPGLRVSNPHPFHKKTSFEPVDCFPEPVQRASGEISLYGEIERRLRKRGIDKPCKDLETLKQILEALQLKGLLHSEPLDRQSDGRRSFSDDHHFMAQMKPKPPIVLMRPGSKPPRSPNNDKQAGSGLLLGPRRDKTDMDVIVRRCRSPDRGNESVRSPNSPGRRKSNTEAAKSPQRRISAVHSGNKVVPEQHLTVRLARARRVVSSSAEDDTSTSVSGSSVTTSPLDFETSRSDENSRSGRSLLDRCDKLLNNIVAFTCTDHGDPQPSPVSVLDASILTEDSSPSPSTTRLMTPPKSPNPNTCIFEPLFDSSEDEICTVGSESDDTVFIYIREFLHESTHYRDLSKAYELLKKCHQSSPATWQHRMLIYDAVKDVLEKKCHVSPWDSFISSVRLVKQSSLIKYVWIEIQKIRDPSVRSGEMVDLNEATCTAIEKDFVVDRRWEKPSAELSDAVLQIERLVFKDLIADTTEELADVDRYSVPRRKLVF